MRDRLDALEREFADVEAPPGRPGDPLDDPAPTRTWPGGTRSSRRSSSGAARSRGRTGDLATATRDARRGQRSTTARRCGPRSTGPRPTSSASTRELEAAAAAEGPQRRPQRHRRDPRRRGRRGGEPLRPRPVRDVPRLRRPAWAGGFELLGSDPSRHGRVQRRDVPAEGRRRLDPHEARGRSAPRAAGAGHRGAGRIHTSSATVTVLPEAEEVDVAHRPERPPDRRVPVVGAGRAVGEHHRLGRAHHPQAHRPRRRRCRTRRARSRTGRKAMQVLRSRLLKQEQDRQAAEQSDARRDQVGGGGRSREDPHLQLQGEPGLRPPHRPHAVQARQGAGRRARRRERRAGPGRADPPAHERTT